MPLLSATWVSPITAAGHKDKALEYGKDIWMRFTLPTQHFLYFGLQAKRDKLDAAGTSKGGTANVAEMLNQLTMMLGHEVVRPRNKQTCARRSRVHRSRGAKSTKAARNWLGGKLDQTKRSQIIF